MSGKLNLTSRDMAFIDFVKAECVRHNFKLDLRKGRYAIDTDGLHIGGYFDHENRVLLTAMGNERSLGILVHEYCHMTQWEENCTAWRRDVKYGAGEKFWKWLGTKEVPPKNVKNITKYINILRELELDNERRSVAMIRKHKLSINIPQYIREANAYINFYNYIKKSRRWSKGWNRPAENAEVLRHMSTKFDMDYGRLSPELLRVYQEQEI